MEGIDELALLSEEASEDFTPNTANRTAVSIAALTKKAMEGDLPLEAVYNQRLLAVNPTRKQVQRLAGMYRDRVISDARVVIEALQSQDIQVFIVSGGLIEPVREFGAWLGILARIFMPWMSNTINWRENGGAIGNNPRG